MCVVILFSGTVQFVRRRVGTTQQTHRSRNVAQGGTGSRARPCSGALELWEMALKKRELRVVTIIIAVVRVFNTYYNIVPLLSIVL